MNGRLRCVVGIAGYAAAVGQVLEVAQRFQVLPGILRNRGFPRVISYQAERQFHATLNLAFTVNTIKFIIARAFNI